MYGEVWGSLLLGDDTNIVLIWLNVFFCEAWESFTKAPRWAPNVLDKHYLVNLPEVGQVRSQLYCL